MIKQAIAIVLSLVSLPSSPGLAFTQSFAKIPRTLRGNDPSFQVDFSRKAVIAPSQKGPSAMPAPGSRGRIAGFGDLGVDLVVRSGPLDFGRGVPVFFQGGGIGLLTNAILIGGSDASQLKALLPNALSTATLIGTADVFRIIFPTPEEALEALTLLRNKHGIRFAHPDFRLPLESRSSGRDHGDPLLPLEWHLAPLGIAQAWNVTMGAPSTVVAVIDLGFEVDHPDLRDAWYVNPGEIPGNRKDDDGNGLVDDVVGWNFGVASGNLLYGPGPGHGTATAGIIGARWNGIGGVGLCPDCLILPLVIDDQVSSAVSAFHYARSQGVTVVSNSWGYRIGTPETEALAEAVRRIADQGRQGKGTNVVFAMSNKNRDDCVGREPDISALEAVIAVSSVDSQGVKISGAGYGHCLKVLAPSSENRRQGILTTDRRGPKGFNTGGEEGDVQDLDFTNSFHGTSAAAPQVAAALALLLTACPGLTRVQAEELLLQSAEKVQPGSASYDPITGRSLHYGFGRLHVGRLLERVRSSSATDRCAIAKNEEDSAKET